MHTPRKKTKLCTGTSNQRILYIISAIAQKSMTTPTIHPVSAANHVTPQLRTEKKLKQQLRRTPADSKPATRGTYSLYTRHGRNRKKETQLMLTNPRDAFRGQSRSLNIVPFHLRYTFLLYDSNFVIKTCRFSDIRLQKMS